MLRIYCDCKQLVRECRPLWDRIGRFDRSLKTQLQKASTSIGANLAEGAYRNNGNERQRFETAIGSARETKVLLELAEAADYLDEASIAEPADRADKIAATLYRCLHRRS